MPTRPVRAPPPPPAEPPRAPGGWSNDADDDSMTDDADDDDAADGFTDAGSAGPDAPGPGAAAPDDVKRFAKELGDMIAQSGRFEESDLYENGHRRPLSQIVSMSKVAGVWNLLTDAEKIEITDSTGQLANNRPYLARPQSFAPAIRKNAPFVINANGDRISIK